MYLRKRSRELIEKTKGGRWLMSSCCAMPYRVLGIKVRISTKSTDLHILHTQEGRTHINTHKHTKKLRCAWKPLTECLIKSYLPMISLMFH